MEVSLCHVFEIWSPGFLSRLKSKIISTNPMFVTHMCISKKEGVGLSNTYNNWLWFTALEHQVCLNHVRSLLLKRFDAVWQEWDEDLWCNKILCCSTEGRISQEKHCSMMWSRNHQSEVRWLILSDMKLKFN